MCLQDLSISRSATVKKTSVIGGAVTIILPANPDRIALYLRSTVEEGIISICLPDADMSGSWPLLKMPVQNTPAGPMNGTITGSLVGSLDTEVLTSIITSNGGCQFNTYPTVLEMTVARFPGIVSAELLLYSDFGNYLITEVLLSPDVSKAVQEILE